MTSADLLSDEDVAFLRQEIAGIPLFLQGSVSTVARRCGHSGCRCAQGPVGHPTRYLTFKRDGRTRTVYLPDDDRGRLVQKAVADYQRLLGLVQAMPDTVTAKLRGRPWPKQRARSTRA